MNDTPIWLYAKKFDKISRYNQIISCIKQGYSDGEIKSHFYITQDYLNRLKKKDVEFTYEF